MSFRDLGANSTSLLTLMRWLGPWANPEKVPSKVSCRQIPIASPEGGRQLQASVYQPEGRSMRGSYIVAHGLNPRGTDDPRFDRVMRILARSGFMVFCPRLPDFMALRLVPSVIDDFKQAFETLWNLPERPRHTRPGVFSISFGSLPALRLASGADTADRISGAVLFGGYGDLEQSLRYTMGEDRPTDSPPHDPLSMPALALNLLDRVSISERDAGEVSQAWRGFVDRCWGSPEMKPPERHRPVADAMASKLSADLRLLFLRGCGMADDAREFWLQALARRPLAEALDPRPHLGGLLQPVHLIHGKDDDVIPHTQMGRLLEALPPGASVRSYLTGLYDHTRTPARAPLAALSALTDEGGTLVAMLQALVNCGADTCRVKAI